MKRIVTLVVLSLCWALVSINEAYAQNCRTCRSISGGCFDCPAVTNGGKKCILEGCDTCTLSGICHSSSPPVNQLSDLNQLSDTPCGLSQSLAIPWVLKVDANTLREIAATHPRFAATLVQINRIGGLTDTYTKMFWLQVPLTKEDFEWWLKPEQEFAAFSRQRHEKLHNNVSETSIVYEITIEQPSDLNSAILTLKVVQGFEEDPSFKSIQISLARSIARTKDRKAVESKQKIAEWKVTNWQIN